MAKQMTKKKPTVFSFKAPEAKSVLLAGDFTGWQKHPIPMKKQPDGTWQAAVPLTIGEHRYRFLVDGEWRDDPACPLHAPNPFGGEDALVRVGAPRSRTP